MKQLLIISLLFCSFIVYSQTTTSTQPVSFSTVNQPMFGPNPLNLNFQIPIFHVPWNQSFADSYVTSTIVGDYGFQITGGTSGHFGANFYSRNWSAGEIDVNYPVNIHLTYPATNTFERGETITIETSYTVDPAAQLTTRFPQSGNVGLEFDFSLRFYLTPILCFVSCNPVGAFDTGNLATTLTIFDISANTLTYACVSPSLTCTQGILPATLNAPYGLSGTFDLPNTQTTSALDGDQCLTASGEDQYARLQLEIFELIGGLNIPYISPVLNSLSGGGCARADGSTYNICFNYTLFSAYFGVNLINKQDFKFCPDVYTSIKFPVPVEYTVTEPINGGSVIEGPSQSDSITIKVGNDLHFKYPCNYEHMDIKPYHDINNTISNHTYDELSFDFTMEAFKVEIRLDGFGAGENNEDPNNVDSQTWTYGPLFQNVIPLGTLPAMEWFNDSWTLPGFNPIDGTAFQLNPREYSAVASSTVDVKCNGDNTGGFTANVTNGTSPYTFNWSNGTTNSSTSNNSLEAGNHHVVIEDANGCMAYASYNVTEPNEALQIGSSTITAVSCNGLNDGRIALAVFGGTPPYSYNWSSGSGGATVSNIGGGTQSVTITDANGCSLSQSFEVPLPNPLSANFEVKDVSCFGGADGVVEILPTGGTAPYSYNWSNGDNTKVTDDWSAGSSSVTITDINGCSSTVNFTVGQPNSPLSTSGNVSNVSCFDGNDGSVNASTSGGTAPYVYTWSDANYNSNESYSNQALNLHASNWTATVIDAKGCIMQTVFPVTQPAAPLLVDVLSSNVSCKFGNDGFIDLTVSGGTPSYSYSWSNGQGSQDATNLVAGNYSITVLDANGCAFSDDIEITEPTNALEARLEKKDVTCFGDDNGEAKIIHTGGNPQYSYSWTTGETTQRITLLDGGNYSGTLTDGNGCVITLPFTIVEASAPLSIAGVITHIDCKGNDNGVINSIISGGTPPYLYEWVDSYAAHLYQNIPVISNLIPDTYTLIASDANDCHVNKPFSVTEPDLPLSYEDTVGHVSCKFGNDGFINLTTFGGTAPYFYNWSNGATTEDISNLTTGTYSVVITDNNGCIVSLDYIVREPYSILKIIDFEQLNVKCNGWSDGFAKVVVYGGTPDYSYLWSNGVASDTIQGVLAGTYQCVITDSKGCLKDTTITITEPDNLLITSEIDSVSCYKFSDGVITASVTGGTLPYRIAFGDSSYSMMTTGNSLISDGLIAGDYYISVLDSNRCQFTQNVTVFEPDTLLWEITSYPASCYDTADGVGDLTVTGGTPFYTITWSNGDTSEDLLDAHEGDYEVVIYDIHNCTIEGETYISHPDSLYFRGVVNGTTCIDNEDGTIDVFVEGGVGDYSYLWSNEEITRDIYNLSGGEYFLEIQDQNGCVRRDTFFINTSTIDCIDPPTAFTPDGDGYNDTWVLDNIQNYEKAVIQIFNKWGTLIFESGSDYTPWDGSFEGNPLPSATYYYVIDLHKGTAPYTGPVTIVKKN